MSGTGLKQTMPTRGMRIATPCANQVEFIEAFHRYCEDNSFFVSTLTMREIGLVSAFSVDLTDGRSMLRGYGVVLDAWPTADNRFRRPGVHIGIHKLTADSQAVFDQLLIARAVTADRNANKAAARTMTRQLWAITPSPMPAIPAVTPRATPSPVRPAASSLAIVVPRVVKRPVASDAAFDQEPTVSSSEAFESVLPADGDGVAANAIAPLGDAPTVERAIPVAAAAATSEGVTFETPTRTASPTYATLANERAASGASPTYAMLANESAVASPRVIDDVDDDAPTKPPAEPAPLPPLAFEPPHRPSPQHAPPIVTAMPAPPFATPIERAARSPAPFATPIERAARPRSWWRNPRVAAVFVGGLALGFAISLFVRSPDATSTRPIATVQPTTPPPTAPSPAVAPPPAPPATATTAQPSTPPPAALPTTAPTAPLRPTTAPAAPPTTAPAAPPPAIAAQPTARPPAHVAPARPIAKPAPKPIAKPARPIAKPIARPVRPKPVAKPTCDGLSCI